MHNSNEPTNHAVIYVRLAQLFKGDEFPALNQEKEKERIIANIFIFIKIHCSEFLPLPLFQLLYIISKFRTSV